MLTTKLTPPEGGNTEFIRESWAYALEQGRWTQMRGHWVLMLGNADYVEIGGRLYSVNRDPGTDRIPFGIRWEVTELANGHLDQLAREQFYKRAVAQRTADRGPMDQDVRAVRIAQLVKDWTAPKSRCRCGHTGDGPNSEHISMVAEGHGGCLRCDCAKFRWGGWTAAFAAALTDLEEP